MASEESRDVQSLAMANGKPQHSNELSPSSPTSERKPAHQRFAFADPAAFRYLEEDPSTTVLERRRRLHGYELYFIEQWACSRIHPTFVITTYTGLEQHSVLVSVLSVPTDEEAWSPRLRVYFKAIAKYHARKKDTPLGTLMVTNLSGFPSALTVILVPDGDLKKHREDFIVNENLKRMGCAGRAGLNLSSPVQATEAKFNRLYRTSDRIPLYSAVIELVKLCQAALVLFGKLPAEYADGLLCDVTEQAINDWWNDIGVKIYNVEPSDGILGPTTVAAMIGLLIGARNRLHAQSAPIAKDVFDLAATKRGIAHFQKSQKLPRTRRLDGETLRQLHNATTKAAKSSEGWNVPRAVKSTVAELSGKGHDLVAGEAREKAGFADVETLDIETFVQLASGERAKWLWYGKPRKSETDVFKNLGGDEGRVLEDNDQGGYMWSKQREPSVIESPSRYGLGANIDGGEKDQALRRAVLKSVTGRMTDARSGLGRIRDRVGMRSHHQRHSKEAGSMSDAESLKDPSSSRFSEEQPREHVPASLLSREATHASKISKHETLTPPSPRSRQGSDGAIQRPTGSAGTFGTLFNPTTASDKYAPWEAAVESESEEANSGTVSDAGGHQPPTTTSRPPRNTTFTEPIDAPKATDDSDSNPHAKKTSHRTFRTTETPVPLLRTTSSPQLSTLAKDPNDQNRYPRHLSFSTVIDVLYASDEPVLSSPSPFSPATHKSPTSALAHQNLLTTHLHSLHSTLTSLLSSEALWIPHRISLIETLDTQTASDQEFLEGMYRRQIDDFEHLKEASEALLADEKSGLEAVARDMETLAQKLEYELGELGGKVEDLEGAVKEFERGVQEVESRAKGAMDEGRKGLAEWVFEVLLGGR
ncbi:MAG: hypothetical protein Q9220_005223 [cf. Caloplaca sp. 1 TL-2023]